MSSREEYLATDAKSCILSMGSNYNISIIWIDDDTFHGIYRAEIKGVNETFLSLRTLIDEWIKNFTIDNLTSSDIIGIFTGK